MWKAWLLAAVSGWIVMFGLGGIWHLALLSGFYSLQTSGLVRPDANTALILAAEALRSMLYAWIYPTVYKGAPPLAFGIRFGIVLGLVTAVPLAIYSAQLNVANPSAWLLVEVTFALLQSLCGGVVIAFAFARTLKRA